MDSPRRSRTSRHVFAASQCIRSWSKAGIYQPRLPLELLDRTDNSWLENLDQKLRNMGLSN
ncbi:hypothetical protein F4860DRAFT_481424 [Xylaria cubensis]|nr:hypothetical protein F4860DRAFT_481424 [Xylaria cubensis]